MSWLFATIGLGIVLFVSTNIDDIFVLLAFFADVSFRPNQIVLGQLVGISALFLLSVLGALLALTIAPSYVGLLGLVPLGMGALKFIQRHKDDDDENDEKKADSASSLSKIIGVALTTIANGGDNIGVYVPVFTNQPRPALLLFAIVFALMTAIWCWVGYSLVNHPKLGAPIKRYAKPVTPFVLILLGVLIIVESKAYSIVGL